MTVNPDELLIFKMRGMTTKKKAAVEAAPAAQPEEAKAELVIETKSARPIPIAKPKIAAEQKARRPLFAPKSKPAAGERAKVREEPLIPIMPVAEEEEPAKPSRYDEEDEKRMRELQELEQRVSLYVEPPRGLEAEENEARVAAAAEETNSFSKIAGLLFLANALLFGYFVLPQSAFVLSYIAQKGFGTFVLNWSYEYGTSFINLILALLSAVSGLLMLANIKRSHLLSGATGSLMLLALSFEYLTSSVAYLLVITIVTFVSIVLLAYARMSAVSAAEQEQEQPASLEVNWPRIETF